jgi:hypothetical protein
MYAYCIPFSLTLISVRVKSIFDGLVKSPNFIFHVFPAKAGIRFFQIIMDTGFRRCDEDGDFLRIHQLLAVSKAAHM